MTVDMKKAFAYSLATLKVQKIFQQTKKSKTKKSNYLHDEILGI